MGTYGCKVIVMAPPAARRRNPRGQGGQLRDEILTAARELLIETGTDSAVTLRAIARKVGIAPPSIYAHFDTPDQIVEAVVTETRSLLVRQLETARAEADGARERLLADCRAYLAFGAERPELYALLFSRPRPRGHSTTEERVDQAVHHLAPIVGETVAAGSRPPRRSRYSCATSPTRCTTARPVRRTPSPRRPPSGRPCTASSCSAPGFPASRGRPRPTGGRDHQPPRLPARAHDRMTFPRDAPTRPSPGGVVTS